MANYVLGFAFEKIAKGEYKVAILKKNNKFNHMCGMFNGVGGKVEEDEGSFEAMSREFREETGVFIPEQDWKHFYVFNLNENYIDCFVTIVETLEFIESITKEEVKIFSIYELNRIPKVEDLNILIKGALNEIQSSPL